MSLQQINQLTVLFQLLDGTTTGPIRVELGDFWSGLAYRIPKKMLAVCKDCDELNFCGIYFLFGNYDETGEKRVYIGQVRERKNGESLLDRLAEHDRSGSKDFCSEIVFFTVQQNKLGPTELCYLENRFWNLAREANRYRLMNGNEPSIGNATEAKRVSLEKFIEKAKILINLIGFRVFEPVSSATAVVEAQEAQFVLKKQGRNGGYAQAGGRWANGKFVVLKGSKIIAVTRSGLPKRERDRRKVLKKKGKLEAAADGSLLLKADQQFDSPSAAGAFVLGGSCNGRTEWQTPEGKTFAEIVQSLEEQSH